MKRNIVVVIFFLIAVVACSKSYVKDPQGVSKADPNIRTLKTVGLIGPDADIVEKVLDAMQNADPKLSLISLVQFRDSLFPWFEPDIVGDTMKEIPSLMKRPIFIERIKALGVRYVVFLKGGTTQTAYIGDWLMGAAAGGYCIFGHSSSYQETELSALIWDLEKMVSSDDICISKSGTKRWIGLGLFPVFIPTRTEGPAIKELAKQIVSVLDSGTCKNDEQTKSLDKGPSSK